MELLTLPCPAKPHTKIPTFQASSCNWVVLSDQKKKSVPSHSQKEVKEVANLIIFYKNQNVDHSQTDVVELKEIEWNVPV